MARRFLSSCLALALLLSMLGNAAAETVWSGLVMAENVPEPTPIPAELVGLEKTLKNLFGYNQFQVIGQSRKTLRTGQEDWLASSKYFALHVDSKGTSGSSYLLSLQLFQEQKLVIETEARLSQSSPLLIKGPQIGAGQLVLVLVVE